MERPRSGGHIDGAHLRTHITHDTNREHDFPMGGSDKDSLPQTSDVECMRSLFKYMCCPPPPSRPTPTARRVRTAPRAGQSHERAASPKRPHMSGCETPNEAPSDRSD